MNARIEDQVAITGLMNGWMHRDLSEWDQLTFNGDRALVQTNAMVMAENVALDLGSTTHNRFGTRGRSPRLSARVRCAGVPVGAFRFANRARVPDPGQ